MWLIYKLLGVNLPVIVIPPIDIDYSKFDDFFEQFNIMGSIVTPTQYSLEEIAERELGGTTNEAFMEVIDAMEFNLDNSKVVVDKERDVGPLSLTDPYDIWDADIVKNMTWLADNDPTIKPKKQQNGMSSHEIVLGKGNIVP